jgi:hypothetical protein
VFATSRGGIVQKRDKSFQQQNQERSTREYDQYLQRLENYNRGLMSAAANDRASAAAERERLENAAVAGLARERADKQWQVQQDRADRQDRENADYRKAQLEISKENARDLSAYRREQAETARTRAGNPSGGRQTTVDLFVAATGNTPGAERAADGNYYVRHTVDADMANAFYNIAINDAGFLSRHPVFDRTPVQRARNLPRTHTAAERIEIARLYLQDMLQADPAAQYLVD